jgi:cell division septum initiation protein DivIVA
MTRIPKGQIRPKISTMPRQQTEAAAYLDIYKLVIEKKRLRQELEGMDDRRQQICDRLAVLEQQIVALEQTAHQAREAELPPGAITSAKTQGSAIEGFDTLSLDY